MANVLSLGSRRVELRLQNNGRLRVRWVGADALEVLALNDVSLGGFSIVTTEPVRPGLRARFEFTQTAGPLQMTALATSRHCRPAPNKPGHFTSGWMFVRAAAGLSDADVAISAIVDALTDAVSFD